MRTTLSIDATLLERAKRRAAERGTTLGKYVEGAIQRDLAAGEPTARSVELPVFAGGSPRPGVDLSSNLGLYEALGGEGAPT